MSCSVCKNKFIITKTNLGYMIQKKIIEDQLIKYIDENMETNELDCWDKTLNTEAMLLSPTQKPNKCITESCCAEICNYCYIKSNVCMQCKNPPPLPSHQHTTHKEILIL
jgi:hypothetical protein